MILDASLFVGAWLLLVSTYSTELHKWMKIHRIVSGESQVLYYNS